MKIEGITMIERVYKQSSLAKTIQYIVVATDDDRIAATVKSFGGNVVLTSKNHLTGTDRLAEVAKNNPDYDIIINVQGDEPLINPKTIDAAVQPLLDDPKVQMSTIATPLYDEERINNPSQVKVVIDNNNNALYFSRLPIPYNRDNNKNQKVLGHIGLYVYRRESLLKLTSLSPSPLELAESLEQLRALSNGIGIKVIEQNYHPLAVDVPADIVPVEQALKAMQTNFSSL